MQEKDIIQWSNSSWASQIMLMTRKDCTTRFCVDYHKLNEVARKDAYPLSRIDMTLDTCVDYAYPLSHTDIHWAQ